MLTPPQTRKIMFVIRNRSQIPQNQNMPIQGKEHETAVKNNSAAVGLSYQLSTILPASQQLLHRPCGLFPKSLTEAVLRYEKITISFLFPVLEENSTMFWGI